MGATTSNLLYLVTIICFILALRFLSSPTTARRGNWIGAVGMVVAIAVTLAHHGLHVGWRIPVGGAIGTVFGAVGARRVKMTAMPQMVALFNGVGGGAAALVSLAILAIGLATVNVVGGYAVTDRMLKMFRRRQDGPPPGGPAGGAS